MLLKSEKYECNEIYFIFINDEMKYKLKEIRSLIT